MSFAADIQGADAAVLAEFGEDLVYTPKGGGPVAVKGIFDEAYARVELVGECAVQTTSPAVVLSAAVAPAAGFSTEGDAITRDGTVYYVGGVEPSARLVLLRLTLDPTV